MLQCQWQKALLAEGGLCTPAPRPQGKLCPTHRETSAIRLCNHSRSNAKRVFQQLGRMPIVAFDMVAGYVSTRKLRTKHSETSLVCEPNVAKEVNVLTLRLLSRTEQRKHKDILKFNPHLPL